MSCVNNRAKLLDKNIIRNIPTALQQCRYAEVPASREDCCISCQTMSGPECSRSKRVLDDTLVVKGQVVVTIALPDIDVI